MPRKAAVELPPIPPGNISELPPLSRPEKTARLATLLAKAQHDLHPYLNDIATKIVFGEGDPDAPIMFIGEGPGIEEDRLGRPFVGRSGQLLDKQIAAMGYQREQVFIGNIVKLRSASYDQAEGRVKDRPPTPEEVARNIPFLHQQIEIIRPQAIVTLGAPAIKWLTGTTVNVSKIRGTWQNYRGIPLMPTFHPAYLLRNYTDDTRRKVWEDLQQVMAKLGKKKTK